MRILVVDDNVDSANMLVLLLRVLGHQGLAVYSGSDAMQAALEFRPGLVILDLSMPDLDGFALARMIRAHPEFTGLRLVALSGHVFPRHREASREAGIDVHLEKPIMIEDLRRALD